MMLLDLISEKYSKTKSMSRGHLSLPFHIFPSTVFDFNQIKFEFPLAPMGVSLPVPGTRDPPLRPPSALAEIFRRTFLQNSF